MLQERTYRLYNLEIDVQATSDKIAQHDEEMLKITRVLQRQIDEKQDAISKYEEKLKNLETATNAKLQQTQEQTETYKKDLAVRQEQQLQD